MSSKSTPPPEPPAASKFPECFVIMPISEPDGHPPGHFRRVYDDIITPACLKAGFKPFRADDVKASSMIHLDILKALLDSPMAICDLSSANPNVLFELALRQAFDKPVALIQEVGTRSIFDIAPLRYKEYRKERIYHEVLQDQAAIQEIITSTYNDALSGQSVNSIVKLLSLSQPATLPQTTQDQKDSDFQRAVLDSISQLRSEIRSIRNPGKPWATHGFLNSVGGGGALPTVALEPAIGAVNLRSLDELTGRIEEIERLIDSQPEAVDPIIAYNSLGGVQSNLEIHKNVTPGKTRRAEISNLLDRTSELKARIRNIYSLPQTS